MELPRLLPLALLALFCLRRPPLPNSRALARRSLVRLGRGRPRTSVRAAAGALVLIAVGTSSMSGTVRVAARFPEALDLLHTLGSSVALVATALAGLVLLWGARIAPVPPLADLRLSEAARRLGLSTEETIMRAIDEGLPRLEADGNTGSRQRQDP